MKKNNKDAIIVFIVAIMNIISFIGLVVCSVSMIIYRFQNPELSNTQLLIYCIKEYGLWLLYSTISYILLEIVSAKNK